MCMYHRCFPPRLRILILHAPARPSPLQRIMHAIEHVLAQMPGRRQAGGEIEMIASALVRASSLAAPPAGLAIGITAPVFACMQCRVGGGGGG